MARHQEPIRVPHETWVELTNSDAVNITFQVLEGQVETYKAGAVQPASGTRGWLYRLGQAERNIPLAEIANGAGTRIWAYGAGYPHSTVLVDHA